METTQPSIPDNEIDQRLIAQISSGDTGALATLYDRHGPKMLGLAVRILRNRTDAEDLVHDVFLEAWKRVKTYDARRGSVQSWLLLRLRSRAIDRLRRLAMARAHGMFGNAVETKSVSVRNNAVSASDHVIVLRALQKLSEEQRLVVELSYFEGLTYKEIAERCGVPVGTVKSRLSAAIGKLRKYLNPVEGRD